MKKIIISPQAGLGNRLRVLASGFYIAQYLGRELYYYWRPERDDRYRSHVAHVNDMKDVGADYFFDLRSDYDGGVSSCYTEWLPNDFWYNQQNDAQRNLVGKRLRVGEVFSLKRASRLEDILMDSSEEILLETSCVLLPEGRKGDEDKILREGYKELRLNERWRGVLDNLLSYDNGVAIRRGNFLDYNPKMNISLDRMEEILRGIGGSKVIFSDDIKYRDELRIRLGCYGDVGGVGLDNYWLQFLLLGKSGMVYGIGGSSFSKQAALYGGVGYKDL